MLTINLLSKEKRHEEMIRSLFRRCIMLLQVVLIVGILIAIVALGTKMFLLDTVLMVVSAPTTNVKTMQLEHTVRKTNAITTLLDRLHRDTLPWSSVIMRLTDALPQGVTLTELTLQQKTKPNLILKGKAVTRNDLLIFKTALERLPIITNLSFPIANLLSPKDITWQLEATIDFSAFK